MPSPNESPVALVTGAARRVGAAIVRELHGAGWRVAVHYRPSRAEAEALAVELEAARPDSVLLLPGELEDVACCRSLVQATLDRFGRLDGLVNNASAFYPTPLDSATPEQWDALFATNARAPFFLIQAAREALRASRGAVVNIGDIYAEQPRADLLLYLASKASLHALTRALAVAMGPEVRVNAIAPGAILWPEGGGNTEAQARMLARTPLGRIGTLDEVAAAVRWLLADASYLTGQILPLDGGRTVAGQAG